METKASGTTPGHADSSYRSWLSAVPLLRLHRRVKDRLPVRVGFEKWGAVAASLPLSTSRSTNEFVYIWAIWVSLS